MEVTFKLNPELDDNLIYLEAKEKNELINTIILDIESQVTAIECLNNGDKSIQPIHNFIRFISSDKKIFGYTDASKEFSIKYRLYQLEDMLPSQFVRISNTEIVNIRAVQQFKLVPQDAI